MYDWIVFDADETLFSFDSYAGLKHLFADLDIDFSYNDFEEYQLLNRKLWVEVQAGLRKQDEVRHMRFEKWATDKISTTELNNKFLDSMALTSTPLEGVLSLLKMLSGKVRLGIITNGFARLQKARLENLGLTDYFDFVLSSDVVGVAKPHPAIFDHALARMSNPARERVLMVGDTFESDIIGGINSGLHTCWINHQNKVLAHHTHPTYQVSSAQELEKLLAHYVS